MTCEPMFELTACAEVLWTEYTLESGIKLVQQVFEALTDTLTTAFSAGAKLWLVSDNPVRVYVGGSVPTGYTDDEGVEHDPRRPHFQCQVVLLVSTNPTRMPIVNCHLQAPARLTLLGQVPSILRGAQDPCLYSLAAWLRSYLLVALGATDLSGGLDAPGSE